MTRTNLITGFLGSGKTTTLRYLLTQKPENERWAILVNEFGEIGIDGALLADSGAILKEIPGGCMCCVNGLPMQVGLNLLLQQNKPDRLLIEPTGLGHPKQILSLLNDDVYRSWITLQATFCLLDARQLSESRFYNNENFRDQLAAADIIVANKQQTYSDADLQALQQWQQDKGANRPVIRTDHGVVDAEFLNKPRQFGDNLPDATHHHTHKNLSPGLAALSLNGQQRWRRAVNQGQGYFSCGWIFDADTEFTTIALLEWARLAPVERVKLVARIPEGTLIVNRQGADLHIETRSSFPVDSRIEVIHSSAQEWNTLQQTLLAIRQPM